MELNLSTELNINYNMKLRILLITALVFAGVMNVSAQSFNVATFNIRYDNRSDSGNLWVNRAPIVANLIRFHDFDVFGVQEALKNQLNDISAALPGYARYGVGRDDGKEGGEHSSIYYKKDMFKLLKSGDFWLSQTPDKPGKGWDATCCNRICSWVYLEDIKSKKKFYLFNVHFDHQGVVARKESAKLILEKIREIAGSQPVLLTGDLNGGRESEWYQTVVNSGILKDVYKGVKYPYENNSSMNSFRTPRGTTVIDHIFMSKQFSATRWGILTDTYFGKFPSDHFPVVATVSF
jgi:endonuclease/exonuclease/phosphatase family metal-dependent hydrolase